MSSRFPLLARCDERQLERQALVSRLHAHGIEAVLQSPPGAPCLRFRLSRPDGVVICRVDASTWAGAHLPALAGLDWEGMDAATITGLTAQEHPVRFDHPGLDYEHAEPLVADAPQERIALPTIRSAEGPVWIEHMDWTLPSAGNAVALPSGLRMRVRLYLARLRMSLRRLRRLQCGDIVLLAEINPRACCGKRALFDYNLHPEAITVNTLDIPDDDTFDTVGTDAEPRALLDLSDLPVNLDVSLGQLHLSLSELSTIQPDSVLPLSAHAYRQVQLQHDGQIVASGELVQVGDRLGVQLTRVARLK